MREIVVPVVPPEVDTYERPVGPQPPTPTERPVLLDAMWALGFDPLTTQAVIITETSAIAVSAAYPEPYHPPQETTR